LLQVAVVGEHDVGGRLPLGGRHLRRDAGSGLVRGHPTGPGGPGHLLVLRRGHHHQDVAHLVEPGLDDQRRVEHDHVVGPAMALDDFGQHAEHLGVHDGFQGAALALLGEDRRGDGASIELPGRREDLVAEQVADLLVCARAGVEGSASQLVGIDHHGAAVGQHPGHGRLPGAQAAGQPDQEHGRFGGLAPALATLEVLDDGLERDLLFVLA
jgi:hypothetical protein